MSNSYTPDNASGQGVALAHTVFGSPVTATMRPQAGGEGIGPATWSTAPYKKKRRVNDKGATLCAFEGGCKAYPMKDQEYCTGHARSLGIIQNWKSGRPKAVQPDESE
jgi:hypothetical protein